MYKGFSSFVIFFLAMMQLTGCSSRSEELILLAGTYTEGDSRGIYLYHFNTKTLEAKLISETPADNPSFLTLSDGEQYVYAVSESGNRSAVLSYVFSKINETLEPINMEYSSGADPCYLSVSPGNRFVVTADYSGGSINVFPILKNGAVGPAAQTFHFEGCGPDSLRQKAPHLHCVTFSPDGKYLFATDLGTDRIYVCENDHPNGLTRPAAIQLSPGSGPRHLVFNKEGSMVYLINELSGNVTVFKHNRGKLHEIQSVQADTCQARGSADIHLSPDGNYLYASTRLKGDGIVVFKVNKTDGTIEKKGYHPTEKHPRNFLITPDGKLMLVACKDGGCIQIFRIDPKSGLLTDSGEKIVIDSPVCICCTLSQL